MSALTPADLRCPRCSSHVRAGSDWCTLCYADLRPSQGPATVDSPGAQEETADVLAGVDLDVPQQPVVGRRRRVVSAADVPTADEIEAVAEQMLARLAEAEARNALGPLAGVLDTRGKRIVFMMVGAGLAMLVILLVALVLGSLI